MCKPSAWFQVNCDLYWALIVQWLNVECEMDQGEGGGDVECELYQGGRERWIGRGSGRGERGMVDGG